MLHDFDRAVESTVGAPGYGPAVLGLVGSLLVLALTACLKFGINPLAFLAVFSRRNDEKEESWWNEVVKHLGPYAAGVHRILNLISPADPYGGGKFDVDADTGRVNYRPSGTGGAVQLTICTQRGIWRCWSRKGRVTSGGVDLYANGQISRRDLDTLLRGARLKIRRWQAAKARDSINKLNAEAATALGIVPVKVV